MCIQKFIPNINPYIIRHSLFVSPFARRFDKLPLPLPSLSYSLLPFSPPSYSPFLFCPLTGISSVMACVTTSGLTSLNGTITSRIPRSKSGTILCPGILQRPCYLTPCRTAEFVCIVSAWIPTDIFCRDAGPAGILSLLIRGYFNVPTSF